MTMQTDTDQKYATLLFERRDAVAYLTLNRPDRLNALDLRMVGELTAAATAIGADAAIRAVCLTGAGRAFCAGADLMRGGVLEGAAASRGTTVGASMREHFNPMISAWYQLPIPVVVAVNGIAAGAGVSLALAGDIVLAARSATFAQLFAPKLGLMPDLGSTFHLPRMLGTARAKGLALLGDALAAEDAARWGLIWGCCDDAALSAEAERISSRFAVGPSQAYRRIKAVFNSEPPGTLTEQLALEAVLQSELADTEDFAEGVRAFHHKDLPRFQGR